VEDQFQQRVHKEVNDPAIDCLKTTHVYLPLRQLAYHIETHYTSGIQVLDLRKDTDLLK
jgi:hypothetical protein